MLRCNVCKKILILATLFISVSLFAKDKDLIYLGAGINNVMRKNSLSTEFRLEYLSHLKWRKIHPLIGASMTTKKQVYAYTGISLVLSRSYFVLAPNLAVGYYYKGDGKDLGFPIEFRTGVELAIRFKNQIRVGAHFSHTSNASLSSKNPGLETLIFFIAIPI